MHFVRFFVFRLPADISNHGLRTIPLSRVHRWLRIIWIFVSDSKQSGSKSLFARPARNSLSNVNFAFLCFTGRNRVRETEREREREREKRERERERFLASFSTTIDYDFFSFGGEKKKKRKIDNEVSIQILINVDKICRHMDGRNFQILKNNM